MTATASAHRRQNRPTSLRLKAQSEGRQGASSHVGHTLCAWITPCVSLVIVTRQSVASCVYSEPMSLTNIESQLVTPQ